MKPIRILAVIFLSLLLMGCSANEEEHIEPMEANVEPIVKLCFDDGFGSGVIYEMTEDEVLIVTASHVPELAGEEIEVVFQDGYSVKTKDFYISETSETAFIYIKTEDISGENLKKYAEVLIDKTRFDVLKDGDEIICKGIQNSVEQGGDYVRYIAGELLYPWIYVEDFAQNMMLVKGESLTGMSGGGIFDKDGYFLGIICGVNENGETAAVPLTVVLTEYLEQADE